MKRCRLVGALSKYLKVEPMVSIVNLRLTYRALENMNFPIYAGSALRGIFGKALRKVSCLAGRDNCPQCAVRKTCPYAVLFENGNVMSGKNEEIPNPYVIEPMAMGQKSISPGEDFSFNCLVFGKAVEKMSYIILAWVKVGNMGFTTERTRARLMKIEQIGADGNVTLLYDFSLPEPQQAYPDPDYAMPLPREVSAVRITLKSPLRIHHNGHPIIPARLTAQDFLISLLRRQENLAKSYLDGYFPQDFAALKADTETAVITEADLHWFDWARYSSRQKKRIALGGIMGTFTLRGNLSSLYPYLRMGEVFHLGKSAVLGMGKYTLEII